MTEPNVIDRNAIAARLREAKLEDAELLASFATTAWSLSVAKATSEFALGQSRFGAAPDVPVDFVWPAHEGQSLGFFAQLDLAELQIPELPATGWLLFFFDMRIFRGRARVVYVNVPRATLRRCSLPADAPKVFRPCIITKVTPTVDLPGSGDDLLEHAGIELDDDYDALADRIARDSNPKYFNPDCYHHLLGHPQFHAAWKRYACAVIDHGSERDFVEENEVRRRELLARGAQQWRLLLQIDSDSKELDRIWSTGNCTFFFWIRHADLAAGNFDNVVAMKGYG